MFELSQEPEVLLPSGADKITTHIFALLAHSNSQALCIVNTLLHKILTAAASTEAAEKIHHLSIINIRAVRDQKIGNNLCGMP